MFQTAEVLGRATRGERLLGKTRPEPRLAKPMARAREVTLVFMEILILDCVVQEMRQREESGQGRRKPARTTTDKARRFITAVNASGRCRAPARWLIPLRGQRWHDPYLALMAYGCTKLPVYPVPISPAKGDERAPVAGRIVGAG